MIETLRTYRRLGLTNVARVAAYRAGLRLGVHSAQKLSAPPAQAPFFRPSERWSDAPPANKAWDDTVWRFGWHKEPLSGVAPNWFANPFSDAPQPDASRDWWTISDFDSGDIKGLWELSRFDWTVAWATTGASGDATAIERLNRWLEAWVEANPPYKGPNWKCGQEASIRVIHLITAAWLLGQDQTPEKGLINLLIAHLRRIAPTLSYAIGQQNNHGTSEAAALFIGGSFLSMYEPQAERWAQRGREWLEKLAAALIESDGSFSQYSVNYHRVMLDTYAIVEAWRRHRDLPQFSVDLMGRLGTATDWLWAMIDTESGDAPNIGANDGACILQLVNVDYRDFRPSVQLAAALFRDANAFGSGSWSAPLSWLGIAEGQPSIPPSSKTFADGGYHVLRKGQTMAVLRYPRFRYRPSQADCLHLDLWHKGRNLLRDAGTFSYNSDESEWFSSTAAHNTIEFDRRDQMPRLGRFLFGSWLNTEVVNPVRDDCLKITAGATYTDAHGARHQRSVTLTSDTLICRDTISGNFDVACLRWRLAPDLWYLEGNKVRSETCLIIIELDGVQTAPTLGTTVESRYYQKKEHIPEISVGMNRPVEITTRVYF